MKKMVLQTRELLPCLEIPMEYFGGFSDTQMVQFGQLGPKGKFIKYDGDDLRLTLELAGGTQVMLKGREVLELNEDASALIIHTYQVKKES